METDADESPSLTKKIKTEPQDESPPKPQDQVATDSVHSTKMEATTNVPPAVKKIKMEVSLESPTSQEMKIYMKVMKTITMGVNSSDSIEDVKVKYRDMMGETSNDQRELFFAGEIQCAQVLNSMTSDMMNYGMDVKFNVLKCDTVGKVIAMLQDNSEFLKTQLEYLVYNGKELEDCQTLAFYNIKHDSIVHAVTFDDLIRFTIEVLTAAYGMISFKVNASYTIKRCEVDDPEHARDFNGGTETFFGFSRGS